jgi:nitroimidazol reductase NimA-like FMN-containing flavoprotein (pyridoxamine 5'-phosphate oxidase superfamily)
MLIQEMTQDECGAALGQTDFGRLACVRGPQPYIVPIYFSFDGKHLYGVTTPGQKIEWMRSNPLVCLEIDERTSHYQWTSVIVFGRYEELPEAPGYEDARTHVSKCCRSARRGGRRLASPRSAGNSARPSSTASTSCR